MFCVCRMHAALQSASDAASRNKRQHSNAQYAQYGDYYASDPGQREDYDVDEEMKSCYVCEYTMRADENHEEGNSDCNDPFNGGTVHEVQCSHPCAVCYQFCLMSLLRPLCYQFNMYLIGLYYTQCPGKSNFLENVQQE